MNNSNLFVRKATGLVRAWSVFDAFIYAFFSINLVTLGFYSFSQMYYFDGGLIPALLISAFFILFEVIVYAALIAVMPRAGGDYMWQSRILGGGIGFVLAVTGWWFILWLWVPLYGDMLRQTFITPLLGLLEMRTTALWFAQTPGGLFMASALTCLIVTSLIAAGMKTYALIQKISFWIAISGFGIVCALLLFGNHASFELGIEKYATEIFGTRSGVYAATLAAGEEAGTAAQLFGGRWNGILLVIPYLVFFNLWPNWGATLYGEIRGATDFKRNFWGMASALFVTTVLAIVFLLLIDKTISWEFYSRANGAWWNYAWGYTDQIPPLPVWPYPALLVAFTLDNRFLQILVILLMGAWWFGWAGTLFLSSTRVIFAAAFDRLLPEIVAEIEPRTHTPLYALALMVIPSLIVSALFAWNLFDFQSLTLCSTLVIAVTYLGTTISAILLPYRKPELYRASPIARYNIFGLPLITVAGVVFGVFLVFLLYQWLFDPNQLYGIGLQNTSSILFMGILYLLAAGIYTAARAYRKREGIDLDKTHAEIPIE